MVYIVYVAVNHVFMSKIRFVALQNSATFKLKIPISRKL